MPSKIPAKFLKTARFLYLYGDGHAVLFHEKSDKDAGTVEWTTLHRTAGVRVDLPHGAGRIAIKRDAIPFVLMANAIRANGPSVEQGTPHTKALNIRASCIALHGPMGEWLIHTTPDLIGADITYDPDMTELYPTKPIACWGIYRVGYMDE